MRRMLILLAALLALATLLALAAPACAQTTLTASATQVTAGCVVDFTVGGESATGWRYTLLADGEVLFSHDTPETFVSYLPREEGDYLLELRPVPDATPAPGKSGKGRSKATPTPAPPVASVAFQVAPPLSISLAPHASSLRCGEPLMAQVGAEGGAAPYRCVYTVSAGDQVVLRQAAGTSWHWVPDAPGDYVLTVVLTDAQGAVAETASTVAVTDGPGLSAVPAGGSLPAVGGQQSYVIYAPGDWTASAEGDFITLEPAAGSSGQTLTITAPDAADALRRTSVTITSGQRSIEVPVYQSAGCGVDEELRLEPPAEPVTVDGLRHTAWLNASGSRSFTVSCDGAWTAETGADFLRLAQEDDRLTVTVESPDFHRLNSAVIEVHSASDTAYVHVFQPPAVSLDKPVEALSATADDPGMTLYSQVSGAWKDVRYDTSTLEHSGCAIFALSHALQYLGYSGESIHPAVLAKTYAFALLDGGTMNSTLIGHAGEDFGFKTRYDLYENLSTIRSRMEAGAVYSFSVASGHIAMIAEMSPDGSMFRVIDSAPSATWERIKNARLYRQLPDGTFVPVDALNELEGARYYVENGGFGALSYWLEADYVARRGVRLIQPEGPDDAE